MSKIYHYTNIDAFESILMTKEFWFNRLDRVDDEEESLWGSGKMDIKMSKYVFVSCWTKDPLENRDLWERYTENKGLRITIDDNPFETHMVTKNFHTYFSHWFEIISDCVIPLPNNKVELYDVKYVEDNRDKIKQIIKDENEWIEIKIEELGIYKKKNIWEKQNESRFKIISYPYIPEEINKIKSDLLIDNLIALTGSMFSALKTNKDITPTHIPVRFKQSALDSIEITMGPSTTDEDKKRVKELLKKHTSSNIFRKRVHNSSLIM